MELEITITPLLILHGGLRYKSYISYVRLFIVRDKLASVFGFRRVFFALECLSVEFLPLLLFRKVINKFGFHLIVDERGCLSSTGCSSIDHVQMMCKVDVGFRGSVIWQLEKHGTFRPAP